jgi:kinesin family protein 11
VHLKEYSAEIETLRVQLQLTREKNGVYMTPADFGAMENRIASLQTQLGECEGALRARNDEVKQIKMTSDALESRLLEATDALANTRIELDETRLTLTGAQRALEETRADLRASEAVVWEQAACEKLLRIESEALVVEVTRCRGSIESLQDKVDDYRGMEVRDGRRADEFLEKLSISRSLLQSSVDELIVESEHSSGAICGGISDLLSSGRETCLGLLTSIDAALRVLVGDADVSRSQLENSLSGLRIHLNSSRDALVGELAALGARLEAALRDIEEASQRTDTLLLNQGDNVHASQITII